MCDWTGLTETSLVRSFDCLLGFRPRLATILGCQEAVGGIGYMLGPTLGGLLYEMGGIAAPMLSFSILVLLMLPGLFRSMAKAESERLPAAAGDEDQEWGEDGGGFDASEGEREEQGEEEEAGLTASQLVNVSTVNSTVVTITAAVGFGFVAPVAAPHFKEILSPDISTGKVGLLLAIPALLYAFCSPLSGMISESHGFKRVMFAGMVMLFCSYLLFGPMR